MVFVVFTDRAEVTRRVEFEPEHVGQHEIWIQGLTSYLNQDSVRVKGLGVCEILEVSFDIHYISPDGEEESKEEDSRKGAIRDVEEKIKGLVEEREEEESGIVRNRRQLDLLDTYADGMMAPQPPGASSDGSSSSGPPVASMKGGDLEYLQNVLSFYDERKEGLDRSIRQALHRVTEINKETNNLTNEFNKLQGTGPKSNAPSRDVTVILDVQDPTEAIELELTYLVSCASWVPSYDVRISSDDNSMSLTYFGMVQQSTGEDWSVCDVSLSTATPSLGGTPPELPQQQVPSFPFLLSSNSH